jgi:arylsulfatase A-like enzyme
MQFDRHWNLLLATALAAALGACAESESDVAAPEIELRARHVVFISLDTTRADHFGFMGNDWIRTPRIDALAANSVVFTDHETVAPTTLPSHTSLFTGRYPHHHGTPGNGWMVNEDNRMLPEVLKGAGFHTAGFAGSFALESRFDFAQGFDHYDESFDLLAGEDSSDQNQRSAETVTNAVIEYLDAREAPEHLFLFVHYFDPHRHYVDRGPFLDRYRKMDLPLVLTPDAAGHEYKARALARRYAGEISYLDHHVGRLLLDLTTRGILEDAIVILTCDHGENFAEHFEAFDHGLTVYGAATRVLWVMRLPGGELGGTRLDLPTSSVDVFPTLLHALGLPVPEEVDGRTLALDGQGAAREERARFSQASRELKAPLADSAWPNARKVRAIRRGEYKLIQDPARRNEELYRLADDPHEQRNLLVDPSPADVARAEVLARELEAWANSADPLPSHRELKQSEETRKRLRSLGYLVE